MALEPPSGATGLSAGTGWRDGAWLAPRRPLPSGGRAGEGEGEGVLNGFRAVCEQGLNMRVWLPQPPPLACPTA